MQRTEPEDERQWRDITHCVGNKEMKFWEAGMAYGAKNPADQQMKVKVMGDTEYGDCG